MTAFSLACATLNCSAVIVYVDIPEEEEQFFGASLITRNFDLNGDEVVDFIFETSVAEFSVRPQGDNRVVSIANNNLAPLDAGFEISAMPNFTDDNMAWRNDWTFISNCLGTPGGVQCAGAFFGQTAFIGMEFNIDGETHYGWLQLREGSGLPGGWFFDYAYESEPGVGILAGAIAIPEPSTYVSLILGLIALACFRQKSS